MSPTSFGHYTVIRALGSGGMADVYLAHDPVLDRQVAIKAPHPEFFTAEGRARFAREARAAASLEHFAIVPIYDYNDRGELPWMVMRYLTGGSLEDRIAHRPLAPAAVMPIIERIAAALDYAHGRGVIHRDVKSANILFDDKDNAYLSDFGIAWMATAGESTRLTATGTVRGTFDYISPEQVQGVRDLDGRADLYSLVVVLFEMLTGDVPFRANSGLLVAAQHLSAPVPDVRARRPDLPPALSAVLARGLAKRREDRYPSGAALIDDLRRALGGLPVSAPRPGTPRPATPRPIQPATGRRGLWLAIAGVAALAIALFFLLRDPPTGGAGNGNTGDSGPVAESIPDEPTASPEPTSTMAPPATEAATDTAERAGDVPAPIPNLPDEIVFYSSLTGDLEIYIIEAGGGTRRQLTRSPGDDMYPRVSPDGHRIVFVSARDGNNEIYVMNRDGSDQTRLTDHPADDIVPAWSPDGRKIIFQSKRNGVGDLFVMNDDGSGLSQITTTTGREGHVSWSMSDRLVFNMTVGGNYQLFSSNPDGSDRRQLTASQVDEWSPEWSPDGDSILFLSERDTDDGGIYVMDPDGGNVRLIYNSPAEDWGAVWSADGEQIVFSATQPDATDDLYIMDAAGGNVRLLAERGAYPSWAVAIPGMEIPGGVELDAVTSEIIVSGAAARTLTGLYVAAGEPVAIEVIGGGWRAGTSRTWPAVGGEGDSQVASKPAFPVPGRPIMTLIGGIGDNGGQPFAVGEGLDFIAAESGELWLGPNDDNPADNDGELTVRVMLGGMAGTTRGGTIPLAVEPIPLTGNGLVRLTFADTAHTSHFTPVFATDQSRILLSVEVGDNWQVFEGDPNGGGLGRQLTSGPYDHYQADLSPDGRYFLTSANRDGDGDIYLFDAVTGEVLEQLTNDHALDYHPRWLPDGESFIYSADDDGTGDDEIYLMTLDGRRTQLTGNDAFDGFATPSRDGRYIAFYSGRDGDYEVYVMDADGSNQRRLTTSAGRDASPSFSPDGRWVVFESERGGRYEIYAVPFEGGDVTRLTDSDGDTYFPIISPDGQWLMFQSTRSGAMDIYRQPWDE